ncbi:unnamed protein product [Mucor fragilis]
MKLSFSLALLAFAAASVQAAAPPKSSGIYCVPGSSGKRNGDGYLGYCCTSSDDCIESCKSGVCNGYGEPTRTTSASPPLSTETMGPCISGVKGKRNGDGYLGYCCSSSDDCVQSCKSGVCNGPRIACRPGYSGLGNGQGPAAACCTDSDDCQESCINGRCN